ncbi:MAG: putative quinol monooxygenase [Pseudomonadota bacterium]
MIIISASITTTPANREDIVSLCAEHSVRSRAEPGCISHHIHADCEDPSRLFFHEEWEDAASVAKHFADSDAREFVKRLTVLVGDRPDMQMYQVQEISSADLV